MRKTYGFENFEEFDRQKLKQARNLINEVYEYYYGWQGNRISNRLETIVHKIDDILTKTEERK